MLTDIITNHLNFSIKQAQALLDLFTLTQSWQLPLPAPLLKTNTQADFITFIQNAGQAQWFKPHDASHLADTHFSESLNNQYYTLFEDLDLIQSFTSTIIPDFSVLLGCFETEVTNRIAAFKHDTLNDYIPKQQTLFGLGSNRELGISFDESVSIKKLKKIDLPPIEINMLNLLITEALLTPAMTKHKITYQPLYTVDNLNPVTTAKTAVSLKKFIEKETIYQTLARPISLAIYSNQPYILRQQTDVQVVMGEEYNVIGLGNGLSAAEFHHYPKSINICLGELARLIHTKFHLKIMENPSKELTSEELVEIRALYNYS